MGAIVNDLILDQTFDCGQCFRWNKTNEKWIGVADGRVLIFEQSGDEINCLGASDGSEIDIINDSFIREYLDLDLDYGLIKRELAVRDPILDEAIYAGSGIRIMKQDLWETLISFIVSQNNNIPRIKGCIEKLCSIFGEPICEYEGKMYYSFPSVERLAAATADEIAPVRLGYRAPYILETAKTIYNEGYIRDDLGSYKGVGPKVEACIELFGRHNLEAFPIDVWVKRVMNRYYAIPENDVRTMKQYADEHFYPYGGIAQQYLFYNIREK